MKYTVKAYEVARARARKSREVAASAPRPQPSFSVEAGSDAEARRLVRKRYEQQGRTIRSLNATGEHSLIVYVESK